MTRRSTSEHQPTVADEGVCGASMLGKEEDERAGETDVTEESLRISMIVANTVGKVMNGESLNILYTGDFVQGHNAHERDVAATGHDQFKQSKEVARHYWIHRKKRNKSAGIV